MDTNQRERPKKSLEQTRLRPRRSVPAFGKALVNATDSADHPGVIAWPPLIFLGCAVVGSLLQFMFPVRVTRYSVSLSLGVVLAVVSASLAIWAERVMKAAGTNVRPDRPTLTIVRSGPY